MSEDTHVPDTGKYKKFYGAIADSPTSVRGGPDSLFTCGGVLRNSLIVR